MSIIGRPKAMSANRKGMKGLSEFLAGNGYEIVEIQGIGQDSVSMGVVSLISVKDTKSPHSYAVIRLDD